MTSTARPIGIYYEHPDWFRPLFAELDRRGMPLRAARRRPGTATTPPTATARQFGLVFNRMSPSAYLRGRGHSILYTLELPRRTSSSSACGSSTACSAFRVETSKALQLALLKSLGLPFPAARVINHPAQAPAAAEGLRFPVVVKANIGGSGAGIVRYDRAEDLARAVDEGRVDLGLDDTALVQEFIPARGGHITRVEVLGGRYLYAINVYSSGESFNLCPADICQSDDGVELDAARARSTRRRTTCASRATRRPPTSSPTSSASCAAAGIEVGGVEYIVDDRDGQRYYYDINALSNFVADAPRVVGFDPFVRLVDFLERERR